jgi:hypothetical protein
VVKDLSAALQLAGKGGLDGFLVTDTQSPQSIYDLVVSQAAAAGFAAGRVMAPPLLRIAPAAVVPEAAT